jgi:phytoene synthase
MEMDLKHQIHNNKTFKTYVYGSAEAVGLMCLSVFTDGDSTEYDRLKSPARKLGEAFQKVNFLRDIKDDFEERQRAYFPKLDPSSFNDEH